MSTHSPADSQLHRGLKNRHIQMIALGGAIGTGLFLGSAGVLAQAGPSMILGYAIGGLIAFFIMRQLGEMIVHEPVAGSFSFFANKYWGQGAGFTSGINYWVLYVLVGMAELTAIGKYVQFWYPDIPTWATALAFFGLVNLINLCNVKVFGEAEFWFSIIKVSAIVGMIAFGLFLIVSGAGGAQASFSNLWEYGGFFPHGLTGLISVLAIIMFSFGGLELIGITAAEAENPKKVIPKAINQVVWRILIFYIGALTILMALYPWPDLVASIKAGGDSYSGSPFVKIFALIGSENAAHILNFVVLTAALSVYNSGLYCNSRMLFSLAEQGNAPRALLKLNRFGVPYVGIFVSGLVTILCIVLNYVMPDKALQVLMSLVVAALVLNWAMITVTHLKFKAAITANNEESIYPVWRYPATNYLCLAFVAFLLVIMFIDTNTRAAVYTLPVWLLAIALFYQVMKRAKKS